MRQFVVGSFVTLLSISVLLFSGTSSAQATGSAQSLHNMKVSIPFSFLLSGKTFPAGSYQVRSVDADRIALDDSHSHLLTFAMTNNVESTTAPLVSNLEFRKEGERYILVRIWNANDVIGHELPQTKSRHTSSKSESTTATIRINGTP